MIVFFKIVMMRPSGSLAVFDFNPLRTCSRSSILKSGVFCFAALFNFIFNPSWPGLLELHKGVGGGQICPLIKKIEILLKTKFLKVFPSV